MLAKLLTHILSKPLNGFLIVTISFLVLYASTIPATSTGLHQSDLFLYLGSELGTISSPGYPLYMILLFGISQTLGSWLGTAFAGHLLSAVFSALSLGFTYLTGLILYEQYAKKKPFKLINDTLDKNFLALVATVFLGLSKYYWRYSLFAERYMLSVLLLSVAIHLLVRLLIKQQTTGSRYLYFLALVLGLGISHQWIFIPISLVCIFVLRDYLSQKSFSQLLSSSLVFLVSIISPFLVLFVSNQRNLPYSYPFDNNLGGLAHFVSQNYLGDSYARYSNLQELIASGSIEVGLNNLGALFRVITISFGWLLLPTVILGILLFQSPQKKTHILQAFILMFGGVLICLAYVFDWSSNLRNYPEVLPQILLVHPIVSLFVWFSLYELITRLGAASKELIPLKQAYAIVALPFFVWLGYLATNRYSELEWHNNLVTNYMSQSVLNNIESNSLLTCFTYSSCYSLIYNQQVNELNTQVAIVPFYYLPGKVILSESNIKGFENYSVYPYVLYDIITWNKDERPIYTVDMFEEYYSLLGIDLGFMNYIPHGYYSQLDSAIPSQLPTVDNTISQRLLSSPIAVWDIPLHKNRIEMIRRHLFNASVYMKTGMRDKAYEETNLATSLAYSLDQTTAKEVAASRGGVEGILPNEFYDLGSQVKSIDFVLGEVDKLIESGVLTRATKIALGAITIEPKNVDARLKYAGLLEEIGASDSAVMEYKNVLSLDGGNDQALQRLEYQENL